MAEGATYSPDITELGDKIVALTVAKAAASRLQEAVRLRVPRAVAPRVVRTSRSCSRRSSIGS